jgi:hypothetical protein
VNADHLAFEYLKNAGEQLPLRGCEYVELPGHIGSFQRDVRNKEKATNRIAMVAAALRERRNYTRTPPDED